MPSHWLRERPIRDVDREDIGLLSVPPPDLGLLAADLRAGYAFLAELDDDERTVATLSASDRPLVLQMVAALPSSRLTACW